jgi:hypothetical protein
MVGTIEKTARSSWRGKRFVTKFIELWMVGRSSRQNLVALTSTSSAIDARPQFEPVDTFCGKGQSPTAVKQGWR